MADIPLNHFVRKAYPITTSLSALYVAPFGRAAIILAAYATNSTSSDVTITVGISGLGAPTAAGRAAVPVKPYYNYAKDLMIAGNDTTNLVPSKLILEEYDTFIASCSIPDAITINIALLETNNTVQ